MRICSSYSLCVGRGQHAGRETSERSEFEKPPDIKHCIDRLRPCDSVI